LGALALLLLAGLGSACGNGEQRPPAAQSAPRPPRPAFRLVAITDLNGYLEPCGCQSRPLGGIDKAASELRAIGADGVPALFVSAGSLLFGPGEPGAATLAGTEQSVARQAQLQAETLADALARLSVAAAAPGDADLARGAQSLQTLGARSKVRWLAAGLGGLPAAGGDAPAWMQDGALFAIGGVKIGVLGVVVPSTASGFSAPADLEATAQHSADGLRAQGAAVIVALVSSDARTARRLAGSLKGVDFVVLGGLDSADAPPPERVGSATLLRASRDGHGLLVVDVFRSGPGSFADVSPWTRKAERDAAQQKADELAARVKAWERDPAADKALVGEQKAHLVQLQERVALLGAAPVAAGNAFSARFVELGPEVHDDPEISALLAAHDKRVNDDNKLALADVEPLPVPRGTPGYVGSERCGSCHEAAHAWWSKHPHGRAYATLEKVDKQYSLSCVACHVTGYGRPGGAAVVQNAGLTNVGCESCHGPGSLHAEDPDVDDDKNVKLAVPESTCKGCHNSEHSDKFAYVTYRAKLIVPGHGKPVAATGTAADKK
jgi:hypothetical protein